MEWRGRLRGCGLGMLLARFLSRGKYNCNNGSDEPTDTAIGMAGSRRDEVGCWEPTGM